MKYTPEQVAKLKQIREENPEFTNMIDEIRAQFPGSKIVYIKSGDFELGERPDPSKGVVPNLDHYHYQQRLKAEREAKSKATTQNAKRVAVTKYKE